MDQAERDDAGLLARWRKEQFEAVNVYAAALNRSLALQQMIEGMESLHPDWRLDPSAETTPTDAGTDNDDKPPLKTAADVVRAILSENPDRWFTSGDMVREFKATSEIEATDTAIRLALSRTADRESIRRGEGKGQQFRFKGTGPDRVFTLGGLEI